MMDSFQSNQLATAKEYLSLDIGFVREIIDVCTIIEKDCEQRSCSSVRKQNKKGLNEKAKMAHAIIELAYVIKNLFECSIEILNREEEMTLDYVEENIKMLSVDK